MKLKDWLEATNISYRELAKRTGIHFTVICRYVNESRQPSLGHAITIERVSEGKVTVEEQYIEEPHNYKVEKV